MKPNTSLATHQDLALIFEPDVLASDQFHAMLRSNRASDPERRLMVAMLEDAVSFEEAHSWVNARYSEEWVFSFSNVCEMLGFDPAYLRRGLNRWSALNQSSAGAKPRLKKYRSGTRHRKLRFRSTM